MTGFVPPFEIVRTVRRAGFDPVVPPLREGSVYVLRATDIRGVLMRVVLDARTGTIRDVTRIVPAYGDRLGMASPYGPQPYGPLYGPRPYRPPYGPPPPYGYSAYGPPPAYDGPERDVEGPPPYGPPPRPQFATPGPAGVPRAPQPLAAPTATPTITRRAYPPLPRPRPAKLVSRKIEKPVGPATASKVAAPAPAKVDPSATSKFAAPAMSKVDPPAAAKVDPPNGAHQPGSSAPAEPATPVGPFND